VLRTANSGIYSGLLILPLMRPTHFLRQHLALFRQSNDLEPGSCNISTAVLCIDPLSSSIFLARHHATSRACRFGSLVRQQ